MAHIGQPQRVHEIEPVMEPWELPAPSEEPTPVELPQEEEVPARE